MGAGRLLVLIVGTIWIVAGAAGALPAVFSVMMIDAPGATERPATLALVAAVASFPCVCFFSATRAFRHRRVDELSRACFFLLLPVINLAVAGAAAAWIQQFQGGKFNG